VARYASGLSRHPVPAHAVGETAGAILEQLDGDVPDLVVCFASPHFVGTFEDVAAAIRSLLTPRVLLGCSSVSIIGNAEEIEDEPALSLFAACIPDAELTPVALHIEETPDGATVVGWPDLDGEPASLLLMADPFSFPADSFLRRLDDDRPGLQIIGGLASAASRPGGNRLLLDSTLTHEGAVGVFLEDVAIRSVVSQGCRPIGEPLVVTRSERNVVFELAGQRALDRLMTLAEGLSEADRLLIQRGLHLGIVVDEHKHEFSRGDFLVRNVMGADRDSGGIAVGDVVAVGQTVQFHVRDADAADEDLRSMLTDQRAAAALMFTCNGRGQHLFGAPNHDAGMLAELLGPIPAAGAFCAGEIGPVGGRNFLHGFTASVALFD
jgi:small ligand-binding sensory domain FIST